MIDLHIHTCYSDGTDTPEAILKIAASKNLKAISITDHDTLYGIRDIEKTAADLGIKVVPGVEISSVSDGRIIHILGYNIDPNNNELKQLLDLNSKYFTKCFLSQYSWLYKNHIIDYDYKRVLENMSYKQALHPSDILKSMIIDGAPCKIGDWTDFFNQKVKLYESTFTKDFPIHPSEAVQVIKKAGGVSVFAHPARIGSADIPEMENLLSHGLSGIEVYYPFHDKVLTEKYERFAAENNLIMTGGTDWHGQLTTWGVEIGDYGL